MSAQHMDEQGGLHACLGCGLELDADDRHERCEECERFPCKWCQDGLQVICGHRGTLPNSAATQ